MSYNFSLPLLRTDSRARFPLLIALPPLINLASIHRDGLLDPGMITEIDEQNPVCIFKWHFVTRAQLTQLGLLDPRKLLLLLFVGPPPSLPLTALLARTKSLSCLLVKLMLSQATFILSTFTPTHQTSGTPMETAAQLPIALITLLQPESS